MSLSEETKKRFWGNLERLCKREGVKLPNQEGAALFLDGFAAALEPIEIPSTGKNGANTLASSQLKSLAKAIDSLHPFTQLALIEGIQKGNSEGMPEPVCFAMGGLSVIRDAANKAIEELDDIPCGKQVLSKLGKPDHRAVAYALAVIGDLWPQVKIKPDSEKGFGVQVIGLLFKYSGTRKSAGAVRKLISSNQEK